MGIRTLGAGCCGNVHGRVAFLVTTPELTASTAHDIQADTATLAEAHQDEVTIRTALRVVAHLCRAIQGTLVCALAPSLTTVQSRIFNVFVPTGVGCALSVELVADLGYR